jgi:hypothetical protein
VLPSPPVIREMLKEAEARGVVAGFRKRRFCLFRLTFCLINCLSHNITVKIFHKKNYKTLVTITNVRKCTTLNILFKKQEYK